MSRPTLEMASGSERLCRGRVFEVAMVVEPTRSQIEPVSGPSRMFARASLLVLHGWS